MSHEAMGALLPRRKHEPQFAWGILDPFCRWKMMVMNFEYRLSARVHVVHVLIGHRFMGPSHLPCRSLHINIVVIVVSGRSSFR